MAGTANLARRAIADNLFVAARIFTRLGRDGAAAMARGQLMDLLDRPLASAEVNAARATRALELTRDAGRAFARSEASHADPGA
ncbi:MAG: hypothetical protein V4618_00690 [Pseudomonadota bacterium]